MPHLIIEYSANIEQELKLPELVECLHDRTAEIEASMPARRFEASEVQPSTVLFLAFNPPDSVLCV